MSVPSDRIDKFCMMLYRLNNLCNIGTLYRELSLKEKKYLQDNFKYKDKYNGRRCFILGNAPSVNKVNFSKLSDEIVITVNGMVFHENFDVLHSNFHFLADPAYFKMSNKNEGEKEIIQKMKCLSRNTTLFLPIYTASIARRYGWYKNIDISYFFSRLYFYRNYKEKIDFTMPIPSFYCVIHWCIAFAVYMGCSEIYLLGCDMTNVAHDISIFSEQNYKEKYAFDREESVRCCENEVKLSIGLESMLYGYWKIIQGFSEMYKYCERYHVKMYNCSEESLLKSIPKRRIKDILSI